MAILKCTKYSCLRICSVDNTKVDIDWICTRSKLILQSETNEHRIKTGKQITPYKDMTTKYIIRKMRNQTKQKCENHIYLLL
jgi:hypothetical protein